MSASWIDPRTNPAPPYRGPERPLVMDEAELAPLVAACKQGRVYDAEAWIAAGRPLQAAPNAACSSRRRSPTPLAAAMAIGNVDLVHLLLCNGYRTELEPTSPLNDAMDARRWELLDLLLAWGADPARVDVGTVLATYDRALFERFWAAGVDLTAEGAMASALSTSSRNRPLYGFVKAWCERDPRIRRALDLALGAAIERKNLRAASLCRWAGADPRRRLGDIADDPAEDAEGTTAFERAVSADAPELLSKLGFDPARDDIEPLYTHVGDLKTLRALVAIRPPANWFGIIRRFLWRLAFTVRTPGFYWASVADIEAIFALGGRLETLDRDLKMDLRKILLGLSDWDARRVFVLLRNPQHMDPKAFLELIAHEKLAARYADWSRHAGVDKALWTDLIAAPGVPGPVRRIARAKLFRPKPPVTHTQVDDGGTGRTLSREELYELVWSQPLLRLGKRFGLSDNGLRKRCKAMNVPTPPKGYWRRVELGQNPRRTPLPMLDREASARQTRTAPSGRAGNPDSALLPPPHAGRAGSASGAVGFHAEPSSRSPHDRIPERPDREHKSYAIGHVTIPIGSPDLSPATHAENEDPRRGASSTVAANDTGSRDGRRLSSLPAAPSPSSVARESCALVVCAPNGGRERSECAPSRARRPGGATTAEARARAGAGRSRGARRREDHRGHGQSGRGGLVGPSRRWPVTPPGRALP
jgi:hypothetical protein